AIISAAAKNGSLGGEFVIGSNTASILTPGHSDSGATQSTVDLWFKFPTGTIALEDHTIIMVLDENFDGGPVVVVTSTGGLEVRTLGGYASTQLATINEDTWYWVRWSFETDSSKRVRLFFGENGGEGSWVLSTTHTDANTHTKQYKIGLSVGADASSTVHMDDIVVYEGFDDS
ncbi:MAG: hypothetical protein GVY35_14065, partial [Bacteroidetes bacterium]|nr:hypothetical protein [Bacteroidota bacterium]